MRDWFLPLLAGFGTGILSAWGVGGGTLLLLIMTLFFGVDHTAAQGINLLYFLPTAGISLFFHRKNGLLDKAAIRQAVPAGLVTAAAAVWLATTVDVDILRKPFGIFLLFTGVMALRQTKQKK